MICFMRTTTWAGLVAAASHHYASVWFGGDVVANKSEVKRVLTAEEADRLNADDNVPCSYRPGDESGRFYSQAAALRAGMGMWVERSGPNDVLLFCSPTVGEPSLALAASDPMMVAELNVLYYLWVRRRYSRIEGVWEATAVEWQETLRGYAE